MARRVRVLVDDVPRHGLRWQFVRLRGVVLDLWFWACHQVDGIVQMLRSPAVLSWLGLLQSLAPSQVRTRYVPSGKGDVWAGSDARDRPVVVVLAGLGTAWAFMRPMLNGLSRRGFRVVVMPQLGWNYRSVAELAARVSRFLQSHREYGRVLLVGHSKGGLIAKQVLLNDPSERYTAGAVAISTPFRGAVTARYVYGMSWSVTREIIGLRPGTQAQLSLSALDSVDARMVSISPLFDQMVGLPGTLELGRNETVPAIGHNRLLGDEHVQDLVARELRRLAATAAES